MPTTLTEDAQNLIDKKAALDAAKSAASSAIPGLNQQISDADAALAVDLAAANTKHDTTVSGLNSQVSQLNGAVQTAHDDYIAALEAEIKRLQDEVAAIG